MFTENTAVYLADFGVAATVGAVTAQVLLDQPDLEVLGGRALNREFQITFRVADFPALAMGNTVTIAAASYRVAAPPEQVDDGAFARALLEPS